MHKTEDIYRDIEKNVETRFDTSNNELGRPLPKGEINIISLMKDKSSGKILRQFVALRAKIYSYLTDNNDGDKKK